MINKNSFEFKSIEDIKEFCPQDELKIAYIKKDNIPTIEIKNKNLMIYDGQECKINDYLKQINDYIKKVQYINDDLNDLLDDYEYDHCEIFK